MSESLAGTNITLELDLEILRCSLCKDYLSYSPIFLIPDGKNMCGRCSSVGNNSNACRNFVLETIVSKVHFPCKNKNHGCSDTFVFGSEAEHNNKCAFNPLPCAFHEQTACTWIGAIEQFSTHLTDQHSELTTGDAQFTIGIKEDAKRRFVVSQNGDRFLIDYSYDSKSLLLKYTVAYFVSNVKNQICKIRLSNKADPDCSILLKRGECCSYSDLFTSDQGVVISIQDLLTFLNDPCDMLVSVLVEPLPEQCDVILKHCNNTPEPLINYEILNAHKCWGCKYYLILPMFQYDNRLFCNNCHYSKCARTAVPVVSETSALLSVQHYPCRWNGCNTVTQGNNISNHETLCDYRVYTCLMHNCEKTFTYDLARQHFLTHTCVLFENSIEKKVTFGGHTAELNLVGFLHNEIVRISYHFQPLSNSHRYQEFRFCWQCETSSYNKDKVKGKINFKHQHCKVESDIDISMEGHQHLVSISEMPSCFKKNEELTAVVQLH